MTTQAESTTSGGSLNAVKWIAAIVILIAATLGGRYVPDLLPQLPSWVRIIVLVVLGLVGLGIALLTSQGAAFLKLLKEAQIEARRIVWPTKDETMQTTMIVVAVVLVMSLVLWGLDSLFGWIISTIIG